jgi:hypothetical protein
MTNEYFVIENEIIPYSERIFKMSKVYVLYSKHIQSGQIKLKGATSKLRIASKFRKQSENDYDLNEYRPFELDDPELLDRIAKESRMNK